MGKPTKGPNTILNRHHKDVFIRCEILWVIAGRMPPNIAAAMDPEHHRQIISLVGRINIQGQTIFRADWVARGQSFGPVIAIGHLCAARPVAQCVQNAVPWLGRTRRTPTQIAHRRRSEGHAKPDIHPFRAAKACQGALRDSPRCLWRGHQCGLGFITCRTRCQN